MATKKRSKRPATKRAPRAPRRPPRPARQQPESLRLRSMAASLTVNDLQKSLARYRDVLGFTPGARWDTNGGFHGPQMKADASDIMLRQAVFAKGGDRNNAQ